MGTSKRTSTRVSSRKRNLSSRVRDVDENALATARAAALAALEDDEAPEVSSGSEFEAEPVQRPKRARKVSFDESGRPSTGGRSGKVRGKGSARGKGGGIARHNKTLQNILDAEAGLPRPHGMVAYEAIAAKESTKPPRRLCSVCGHQAPYTCTRCGARFCCLKCGAVHDDTRCLKFTMG